jgi:hypothetical protein
VKSAIHGKWRDWVAVSRIWSEIRQEALFADSPPESVFERVGFVEYLTKLEVGVLALVRRKAQPVLVQCADPPVGECLPKSDSNPRRSAQYHTSSTHDSQVTLIQPDDRKKRKMDRRDAAALSELLWVNRGRRLEGKPVRRLRQIDIAASTDQENRRLTTLRKEAGQARTRLVNKVEHMLRRHNLQWDIPTKRFPTKLGIAWLKELVLPEINRRAL